MGSSKVWIVVGHFVNEMDENLKGFLSEEKANTCCKLLDDYSRRGCRKNVPSEHKQFAGYDRYSVVEVEVEE